MNAITCQEVQDQLDLLAADECDPSTRAVVESHLRGCPACAASYAESQRLVGSLDVHLGEDSLQRLQERIANEARPPRKRFIFRPIVRWGAMVAALVLLAVGLTWWVQDRKASEPQLALLVHGGKPNVRGGPEFPAALKDKVQESFVVPMIAAGGDAFRRELIKAQRDGKLPLPAEVNLELVLVNTSRHSLEMRVGDADARLSLEIQGDGIVRIPAPKAEVPAFLRLQSVQLEPGKQHIIQLERLIAGSPGDLEYIYLTEAGEFVLTPRLQVTADNRAVTVTGDTVRIKVGK